MPKCQGPVKPFCICQGSWHRPTDSGAAPGSSCPPVALKHCWAFQWLQFPEPCPAVCQGDPCSQLGLPQKAPRPPWPCLCGIWAVERGCIQHLPWLEGTNPCEEGTRGDTFPFMGVWNLGLPGTEGTL